MPAAGSDTPAAQQPVAIRIPAIGVESRLIDLGIAKDGTMQVPTDPALAGWSGDIDPVSGHYVDNTVVFAS